jgi:hypothetical protein
MVEGVQMSYHSLAGGIATIVFGLFCAYRSAFIVVAPEAFRRRRALDGQFLARASLLQRIGHSFIFAMSIAFVLIGMRSVIYRLHHL